MLKSGFILLFCIILSIKSYSSSPQNSFPILVEQSNLILIAKVISSDAVSELSPIKIIKGDWDSKTNVEVIDLNIIGHNTKFYINDTVLVFLYKPDFTNSAQNREEKEVHQLFSTVQLNHGSKVITTGDIDIYSEIIAKYISLTKISDNETKITETIAWMIDCINNNSINWIVSYFAPRLYSEGYKLLEINGIDYIDALTLKDKQTIYNKITTTDSLTQEQVDLMYLLRETHQDELSVFLLNQLTHNYQDNAFILNSILHMLSGLISTNKKSIVEKYIEIFTGIYYNSSEDLSNKSVKYRELIQQMLVEIDRESTSKV